MSGTQTDILLQNALFSQQIEDRIQVIGRTVMTFLETRGRKGFVLICGSPQKYPRLNFLGLQSQASRSIRSYPGSLHVVDLNPVF